MPVAKYVVSNEYCNRTHKSLPQNEFDPKIQDTVARFFSIVAVENIDCKCAAP